MTLSSELITMALAFLEGLGLIISPCILPILPIILAGSLDGNKKRPLGIIVGFILFFTLFTFFSRTLVYYTGIDLNLVRFGSYVILFLLGVVMLSSYLTHLFARFTRQLGNAGSSFSFLQKENFFSGIVFGGLIALIWTPCAGPILAAVIVQIILQKTALSSFLVILFFSLGAAIPMLFIALLGRAVMKKITFLNAHTELYRKILGGILILAVFYLFYSETASKLPAIEKNRTLTFKSSLIDGLSTPYPAPPLEGITAWINSSALTLNQLKNKVVLIDFWTYSCINCIRTLPYLKHWYQQYHDQGFEIIGVHSPEFDFEKNIENVKNAVSRFGILYPVALDNQFVTWQNFHNQYWPAQYLINKTGQVVYEHVGEGDDDIIENNIRFLLGITEKASLEKKVIEEPSLFFQTPETYLGYRRMSRFASPEIVLYGQKTNYTFPPHLQKDQWALQGIWKINSQYITSASPNASLKIHFNARKVFIVMGSATGFPITVKLLLNDKDITSGQGKEVMNSTLSVLQNKLYEIVTLSPENTDGFLQLTASAEGLDVYTFTFG